MNSPVVNNISYSTLFYHFIVLFKFSALLCPGLHSVQTCSRMERDVCVCVCVWGVGLSVCEFVSVCSIRVKRCPTTLLLLSFSNCIFLFSTLIQIILLVPCPNLV